MENRNIYKADDFLLFISVLLLLPAAYFAWPWLRGIPDAGDLTAYILAAPGYLGLNGVYALMYLVGAVCAQIGGRYVRYQEKISLRILDEVSYTRKARISEVASRLGMNEKQVEKLVKKLSRVSSLNISIEGDRIVRNREAKAARPVEPAVRKEAQAERPSVSRDAREQSPPSDKAERLAAFAAAAAEKNKTAETQKTQGCLGMGILILLFMTPLWPIPLVILIRRAIKQQGLEKK